VGRPLVEVVLGSYIRPVRVALVRTLTVALAFALSTACGADGLLTRLNLPPGTYTCVVVIDP
jgi:hypothetical protein